MYLFSVSNVSFKVIVQFLAIIIIYTVVKYNRLKTIMFTTSDTVMKCFLL